MTNVANDCLFKYGLLKDSILFSYLEKRKDNTIFESINA